MRHHRLLRALVAGATGAALAVTLAAPAGADATVPPENADLSGPHQRVPDDAAARGGVSALADLAPAACPAGTRLRSTVLSTSFETGLPNPEGANGWELAARGDAPAGAQVARSAFAQPAPPEVAGAHELFPGNPRVGVGTTTYLSFASRGVDDFENVYFGALGSVWGDDLTTDWTRITVPITAGIESDGTVPLVFAHEQDESRATWWEVDDVRVITCGPAPATGVRGDWTADGKVDLLATTPGGDLALFPGTGDGAVAAGVRVGGGWAGMTYLGSPGDINGDRRTDLIARGADGTLFMYAGVGDGVFRKAVPIGQRWNGMTALITSGDVEGDGRPDLMARRSDGTLHLYRFSTTGALTYTRQLGKGWSSMVWLVGVGDIDGDRRGDVLAVNRAGEMYSYRGTATGLVGLGAVGGGWQTSTWLTSPGDLNGDGRGDVLKRDGDGDLTLHTGSAGGVAPSGYTLSTGWDQYARLL